MSATTDITAILVARDEGPRIGISLHSLLDTVAAARESGLTVEQVVVLADPSPGTRWALDGVESRGVRLLAIDRDRSGDPGAVRNAAVDAATGEYVALLDGGSVWSENWLTAAHALCSSEPGRLITHPEVHWFYEQGRELYFPPDQDEPGFDPAVLRDGNCWDAQALAAAAVYRDVPFPEVGPEAAPGLLDWDWSVATLAAGFRHRVVPATINFRRRRPRTLR
ncbi:glycosyltransferase family A protein [Nocardioides sp. HM23]|uniref:glycosyltransferase family A protein n=1 Tax=Nocardioides bizhenqiangii TaxID=3095076 RepID=UPI002ACACC81|nr:glycosyltransferase family A protein [Nocardioides sp. HM23]MDZ5623116.1 glycosyltransferase family A protein [Nocardioides sp. HM23]